MLPALSQLCSLPSPFERDIEDYAAGACGAIEIWLGKLETYLETHSVDDVRRLLDRHRVVAPVAAFQGGLLTTQGAARAEHWAHFTRRLALCGELGIKTLVVACDIAPPIGGLDIERANASLKQAAEQAQAAGARLAIEFQARSAFGNNLETAAAMVHECASPHLGICFDAFHYFVGPSKFDDLAWLTRDNLFHVQLCDLAGQTRELAADSDRILPGDGDFPLAPIVDRLRQIGYEGAVSIEVMNPQIWQVPARQFGEIAITALRKVLGQASM